MSRAVYTKNGLPVQPGDVLEDATGFTCTFVGLPSKMNPLHSCRLVVRVKSGATQFCLPSTYGVRIVEEGEM